jgi:Galactose oxidase, central domain
MEEVTTVTAPPPRAAASAAYDSTLKQIVMFGGYNGQFLSDTWLWNSATSTWTQAAPAHVPIAVTAPMLFPDPVSGRVDEFGGFDGRFYQAQNWRWKNGDWHQLPTKKVPYARSAAVFGTDPVLQQTVVFGGLADVNSTNTWTYNGHKWTEQSPAAQLTGRFNTGAVYDPRFSGIVVFAGFTGQDVNETWLWSANDWTQLFPQQSPPPRESMGMAFDELHQQTVVFGGLNGNTLLNDTWILQTQ